MGRNLSMMGQPLVTMCNPISELTPDCTDACRWYSRASLTTVMSVSSVEMRSLKQSMISTRLTAMGQRACCAGFSGQLGHWQCVSRVHSGSGVRGVQTISRLGLRSRTVNRVSVPFLNLKRYSIVRIAFGSVGIGEAAYRQRTARVTETLQQR